MIVDKFSGEYRWLSNFYPCDIVYGGVTYPSVEHAYVASKTLDIPTRANILTMTAGQAKRYGRTIPIRDDWDDVKLNLMMDFVGQKFKNNIELRKKLIDTTCTIVEGNTWNDTFWGMCNGKGQNMLGRIIMTVRCELQIEDMFYGFN